jgi:hypothetical protein
MTLPTRWPQRTIAIVLVVAAGLFAVSVTLESDDSHGDEPTAETVEHNEARALAIHQTTTAATVREPASS